MAPAGRHAAVPPDRVTAWEIRTVLPTKRAARVLICVFGDRLVALHGFIKKTRATPEVELATAVKRRKELER